MYKFENNLPRPNAPLDNYYSQNYILWRGCADAEMVQRIIDLGESLEKSDARVGASAETGALHQQTRVSTVSWIRHNTTSQFLFDFFVDKIDRVNYHHYGMLLHGMEEFQYTIYPPGGHYVYHNDVIVNPGSMRKLSLVMGLSDLADYSGGEFLFMPHGCSPESMRFGPGDLIVFPSWVPHKVDPVVSGMRRTLVSWLYGPPFV